MKFSIKSFQIENYFVSPTKNLLLKISIKSFAIFSCVSLSQYSWMNIGRLAQLFCRNSKIHHDSKDSSHHKQPHQPQQTTHCITQTVKCVRAIKRQHKHQKQQKNESCHLNFWILYTIHDCIIILSRVKNYYRKMNAGHDNVEKNRQFFVVNIK